MSNEVMKEKERQEIFDEIIDKGLAAVKELIEHNSKLIESLDERIKDDKEKANRLFKI